MSAKSERKKCEFDARHNCALVTPLGGEDKENCLICLITQQNQMLKSSCRIILGSAVDDRYQNDAMEVLLTAFDTESKFKRWVEKYRGELLKKFEQDIKDSITDGEPLIISNEGIMSPDEAMAKIIAMRKDRGMPPT